MTDLSDTLAALSAAADAWDVFVSARTAMNAARPDPIHATLAERALYDERYQADHAAEREHFRTAIALAQVARPILDAYRTGQLVPVPDVEAVAGGGRPEAAKGKVGAAKCGSHFDPTCAACVSAQDWNDATMDRLRAAANYRDPPSQADALREARELLTRCMDQFLFYMTSHRAKGTKEGYEKTATNKEFADEIAAFLSRTQGEGA